MQIGAKVLIRKRKIYNYFFEKRSKSNLWDADGNINLCHGMEERPWKDDILG